MHAVHLYMTSTALHACLQLQVCADADARNAAPADQMLLCSKQEALLLTECDAPNYRNVKQAETKLSMSGFNQIMQARVHPDHAG